MLHTRGKRVVAEALIADELFGSLMRTNTKLMFAGRQVSNLGGFMSGANNNGVHSANGIAAMFIATGQDAANVAESSAAFGFSRAARENGDYYYSITHPLADRRDLRWRHRASPPSGSAWRCSAATAPAGVLKLAEIIAATVLCGELSLGSAILADEWVAGARAAGPQPPVGTPFTPRSPAASRNRENQANGRPRSAHPAGDRRHPGAPQAGAGPHGRGARGSPGGPT